MTVFIDFLLVILGMMVFSLIIYLDYIITKKIIKTIKNAFKPKNAITNDVPITNNVSVTNDASTETPATTIIDSTYIRDNKTGGITRIDKKPISDEEVPYLIEIGTKFAMEREKQSKNPKFHRTEFEKELSYRFASNHSGEIQKRINSFENCNRLAFAEKDINKKIELLEETIIQFEKAKAWFYRTKGGTIYFQDYYEYLHNSQSECFSYIEPVKRYLEECIEERDYLIPEIFDIIESSNGILQKDIYEKLPDFSRTEIQRIVCKLEAEGKITKEKSGNSYLLNIK